MEEKTTQIKKTTTTQAAMTLDMLTNQLETATTVLGAVTLVSQQFQSSCP